MKTIFTALLGALFAVVSVLPAQAGIDETSLYHQKAWRLVHEYYTETGTQACSARTTNRYGDTLDITINNHKSINVWIFYGSRFNVAYYPPERSTVYLDTDYQRWNLRGATLDYQAKSINFKFISNETGIEFLADLMKGSVVALKGNDGRSIVTWSLAGSAATITKQLECFNRILPTY